MVAMISLKLHKLCELNPTLSSVVEHVAQRWRRRTVSTARRGGVLRESDIDASFKNRDSITITNHHMHFESMEMS